MPKVITHSCFSTFLQWYIIHTGSISLINKTKPVLSIYRPKDVHDSYLFLCSFYLSFFLSFLSKYLYEFHHAINWPHWVFTLIPGEWDRAGPGQLSHDSHVNVSSCFWSSPGWMKADTDTQEGCNCKWCTYRHHQHARSMFPYRLNSFIVFILYRFSQRGNFTSACRFYYVDLL